MNLVTNMCCHMHCCMKKKFARAGDLDVFAGGRGEGERGRVGGRGRGRGEGEEEELPGDLKRDCKPLEHSLCT